MKASDLFVKCLEAEGIEYIFGVPGEENADFMRSLDGSDKIRFVLTRHEQGAAFMAEVYGRLTGNPAGCLGTLGPGATNLITGVADANMDRAPMLVLTGQGDSERLHKESHQIMDVVSMFKPVTKWAQSILHPDNIPEIVRKAVRLARTEKPGACHIELAEDIAKRDASTKPIEPRRFRRPVPDDKIIDRAFEALKTARRPVILAGNGCIRKRASRQLRAFCEKTGIGVISTFMAKGAVDMDADYCLYTIGLQAKDLVACTIDAADLVIALGYDMVEYHPSLWNPSSDKRIIHIDFLPAEIDENYRLEVEVVGDLAHACGCSTSGSTRSRRRAASSASTCPSKRPFAGRCRPSSRSGRMMMPWARSSRRRCSGTHGKFWDAKTSCSRTWVPTRCGWLATTTATCRPPA